MNRPARVVGAAILIALSASAGAAQPPPRAFAVPLERLARVAELYRDTALSFSCLETIVSTGEGSHRIQFAYLFVNENGKLRDYRTWPSATTTKSRGEEVEPRNYKVPRYLASAYLWAFVFRSDRQPRYRLKLLGDDEALGRPAIKIKFVPVPPVYKDVNDWAGFAWVDRQTSQILRVEAYTPADWNKRLHLAEDVVAAPARLPKDEPDPCVIDRVITEFDVVKNGLRFPSHVELSTTQSRVVYGSSDPLRERILERVTQDYSKFEFFSVRASDQITRYVDDNVPLPAAP
jgi:hypothetical protein